MIKNFCYLFFSKTRDNFYVNLVNFDNILLRSYSTVNKLFKKFYNKYIVLFLNISIYKYLNIKFFLFFYYFILNTGSLNFYKFVFKNKKFVGVVESFINILKMFKLNG